MEITTPQKINPQYTINKNALNNAIPQQTVKPDDKNKGNHIKPYLDVNVCDNLILQSEELKASIEALAEDMVLNDITIKPLRTHEKLDEEEVNKIKDFWEINQDEFHDQVIDYVSYGFGASEILFDSKTKLPEELGQIPANSLHIEKEEKRINNESVTCYYAVQQVNGKNDVKMRMSHLLDKYPKTDDNLPVCLWLGGGRRSSFFDYPMWISCFNHVSANITLDLLDNKKLNDGNLVSGILVIKRPPATPLDDNIDDTLQDKMENHGSGVFTLELTSLNPEIPLTVDYVQISESNYDYLKEIASKAETKILVSLKMPKARLLNDDSTESMNSHKTATLYKIYGKEVNNRQRPLENKMRKFNKTFFNFNAKIEIETPVFVDDKDIEAKNTIELFNNGLITLGQAINKVGTIYPEFNESEIDYNNPIYKGRYYNGKPLGFADDPEKKNIYNFGDFIDTQKIQEVFSRES